MCPVKLMEKYLMEVTSSVKCFFFQHPKKMCSEADPIWYNNQPTGIHTLGGKMNMPREYTNHSTRATSVMILDHWLLRQDTRCVEWPQKRNKVHAFEAMLAKPVMQINVKFLPYKQTHPNSTQSAQDMLCVKTATLGYTEWSAGCKINFFC